MKRHTLTVLSILFGAFFMLAPLGVMQLTVLRAEAIDSLPLRSLAVLVLLVLGVFLFLGTTYIATHLVVRFFRRDSGPGAA
jgi:hypothetical protein